MSSATTTMKAIHYEKPFEVSVREVPLPKLEHPDDAIIKVTTAGMIETAFIAGKTTIDNFISYLRFRSSHVSGQNGCRGRPHFRYEDNGS